MGASAPRLLLVALFLLLSGCRSGVEEGEDPGLPRRGGEVVIGIPGRIDSLNLYGSTSSFAQDLADLLFLRLLEEQPDFREHPPTFLPVLAQSFEFSEEGRVLTLRLRDDVFWSDGTPTTAHDVRFTWQVQVDPEAAWVSRHTKEAIEDVEVVDDHTVRVRFREAYPYQFMDLNEGNIYPKHVLEAVPAAAWDHTDFSKLLVYNGPFLLAAMNPDSIELRRNPRYFREGLPYLDRVFFRTIPDTPSLLVQLQAGEVDVMENAPPGEVRRLEASARHRIVRFPDRYYGYIGWNTARVPLDRPAVRRALTMAIDRQAIVEGLLWGAARIAVSPILSLFWIHDQGLQPHPFDPKAAAGLLAREGWLDRDGDGWADRSGQPFRIGLLVNQGDPLREDIAVLVQDQLARIGVRVSIRTLEWGVFRQVREEGDFDGYVSAWLASTKVDLKNLLHSAAIGEGGYNYVRYANPEVDSLIDRARASRDFAAAIPLWRRVEGILHEEQPYTLLFERDRINAISSRLRNVRMDTNSGFSNLEEWWIVQP